MPVRHPRILAAFDQGTLMAIIIVLAGYLCGSITSGIIVCHCMNLPNPRTIGSNNIGATNVLRTGSKLAAALTLAGDLLKGMAPVIIARALDFGDPVIAATATATFIGHLFPVWFEFRGGKGVATAIGAITALAWSVGLITALIWLIVACLFRYSSLASIIAACSSLVVALQSDLHAATNGALAVMAALLLWQHRDNIQRLLAGTEKRIGEKT